MAGNKNSGSKPGARRTQAVMDHIVKEGAQWLYDNPTLRTCDFKKWIEQEHGIDVHGSALRYKKLCYEKVKELQDKDIESTRTLRVQMLWRLLNKAQKEGSVKDELAIIQELNKVDNLYVNKVETNEVKDRDIFKVAPEEVKLKKAE